MRSLKDTHLSKQFANQSSGVVDSLAYESRRDELCTILHRKFQLFACFELSVADLRLCVNRPGFLQSMPLNASPRDLIPFRDIALGL